MAKPRILVINKSAPVYDRASGDFRFLQILKSLRQEFEIDYISLSHPVINKKEQKLYYPSRDSNFATVKFDFIEQPYLDKLREIGVTPLNEAMPIPFTVRPTDDYDIRRFLQAKRYHAVWFEFFYLADKYIDDVRRFQPWAHVICDSVDLHFRRLARQCNYLENEVTYLVSPEQEKLPLSDQHKQNIFERRQYADHVKEHEVRAYQKCDSVVMVSDDDEHEFKKFLPHIPTMRIPNIHPARQALAQKPKKFTEREGIVFVGNFDHDPNVTSAIWIKHELAGELFAKINPCPIYIVGNNPPKHVETMQKFGPFHENFVVTGYVPDTTEYLNNARVSIAPILFGAGMNGKIGEAMNAGIPVVTTQLAAAAMNLRNEETCLVADTPAQFATQIARLYNEEDLWYRIAEQAQNHVRNQYAASKIEETLAATVREMIDIDLVEQHLDRGVIKKDEHLDADSFMTARNLPEANFPVEEDPLVSIVLVTHNQWPYTELCLRSLTHARNIDGTGFELVIVDNASSDNTCAELSKMDGISLVESKENLGFAGGCNLGMQHARGKDIILLNNDTIVTPFWISRLQNKVASIPNVGVVGPSTNTESGQAVPDARYTNLPELLAMNEELFQKNGGKWENVKKISGLCMYLPERTIKAVGGFDTDYGIGYFEDDDYCLRIEDAGLKVIWAKDTFIHHFGSVSFEGNLLNRNKILEEGMSKFILKWGRRALDHISRAHEHTLIRPKKLKTIAI